MDLVQHGEFGLQRLRPCNGPGMLLDQCPVDRAHRIQLGVQRCAPAATLVQFAAQAGGLGLRRGELGAGRGQHAGQPIHDAFDRRQDLRETSDGLRPRRRQRVFGGVLERSLQGCDQGIGGLPAVDHVVAHLRHHERIS